MKVVRIACMAVAMLALAAVCANAADEKKEVKLTGTMVCAKCTLKEAAKCTNALQVKDGDKTVTYYIEDEGPKAAYHKSVCPGGSEVKDVTVTGVVSEKDGHKWIKGKVDTK